MTKQHHSFLLKAIGIAAVVALGWAMFASDVTCAEDQSNSHADRRSGAQGGSPDGVAVGERPLIMLTGYWNPTGAMIRHFSRDVGLNPAGFTHLASAVHVESERRATEVALRVLIETLDHEIH